MIIQRKLCNFIPEKAIYAEDENTTSYAVIYCVECQTNGRYYIGIADGISLYSIWDCIACRGLDRPWRCKLYQDINEFGLERFRFQAITICPTSEITEQIIEAGVDQAEYNKDLDATEKHLQGLDNVPERQWFENKIEQTWGLRRMAGQLKVGTCDIQVWLDYRDISRDCMHNRMIPDERPTKDELIKMREFLTFSQISAIYNIKLHTLKQRFKQFSIPFPELVQYKPDQRLISREEAEQRIYEQYRDSIKIVEYTQIKAPAVFECSKGHRWKMKHFHDIFVERQNNKCPICRKEKRLEDARRKAEIKVRQAHNGTISIVEFESINAPATFKCNICEHEWHLQEAGKVLRGDTGCPNCTTKKTGEQRAWGIEVMQEKIDALYNGTIKVLEFTTTKEPACFQCLTCNTEFSYNQGGTILSAGEYPCPTCRAESDYLKTPYEEYLRLLEENGGDIDMVCKNYHGMWTEADYECTICNTKWSMKPVQAVYNRRGCPSCRDNTSFPESTIFYYVCKFIPYEVVHNPLLTFSDTDFRCYADIYIPKIKTIIEYDGMPWHSFEDTAKRDRKREKEFQTHGIDVFHILENDDHAVSTDFMVHSPFIIEHPTSEKRRAPELDAAIRWLLDCLAIRHPSRDEINSWRDTDKIKKFVREDRKNGKTKFFFDSSNLTLQVENTSRS